MCVHAIWDHLVRLFDYYKSLHSPYYDDPYRWVRYINMININGCKHHVYVLRIWIGLVFWQSNQIQILP
jgi:hypothetical protein